MSKDNLRTETLKLKSSGLSNKEISQKLDIPLGTVYRWVKENSVNFVKIQAEIYTTDNDWFTEALKSCDEIATQSRELRLLLHKLLVEHLEGESLNSRLIASLSTALERHTDIEWRARGLDFLDGNRAITRVLAMGYEISDTNTVTTQK